MKSRSPTILIADDDQLIRTMAANELVRHGYTTAVCESGEAALESLRLHHADLAILDLEMPGLSGIETCVRIRENYSADALPIIIATGHSDANSIEQAFSAGATDFVTKPIAYPILIERIRQLLRSKITLKDAARARSALDNTQRLLGNGSWEWRELDGMVWMSRGLRDLFEIPFNRYSDEDHHRLLEKIHPDDRDRLRDEMRESYQYGKEVQLDHRVDTGTGDIKHFRQYVTPIIEPGGLLTGLKGAVLDRTAEACASIKVDHLERFDPVTGLPNRASMIKMLDRAIHAALSHGQLVAVICVELDRANTLQSSLEHEAYNTLVREIGRRLEEETRLDDQVGRTRRRTRASVTHTHENQFAVVLMKLQDEASALRIAARIRTNLGRPFELPEAGVTMSSRVSAGISLLPREGIPARELLRSAERALQHAKDNGGNRVQASSPQLNHELELNLRLESQLVSSVERESLSLEFQPRVDLHHNQIVGLESLARWTVDSEPIGPDIFVPIAERTGLITQIGQWVMREACIQARAWQAAGHSSITISVNVSPIQIHDPKFVKTVLDVLESTGLPPGSLELEITEGVFLDAAPQVRDSLQTLRESGVQLAVDDFGTGYASLPYLLRLPIDTLKLDRIFVTSLLTEPRSERILAGVIALAHNLGIRVVAEGVESEDQLRVLRRYRCDEVQGYIFSKALSASGAEALLSDSARTASRFSRLGSPQPRETL